MKAIIADDSCAGAAYATVDDYILAYDVVVAYGTVGLFTFPTEILRVGTDNRSLVYLVVFTDFCTADYAGMRHYLAVVAYLDISIDVGKRMDCDVVADFGGRVNIR